MEAYIPEVMIMGDSKREFVVPLVKVGMVELQRLEVGGNPFHGISYKDVETGEHYKRRFRERKHLLEVIRESIRQGVTTISISPTSYDAEFNTLFFDVIKSVAEEEGVDVAAVPWMNIERSLEFPRGLKRDVVFAALCAESEELTGMKMEAFVRRFAEDPLREGICRYEPLMPCLGQDGLERAWKGMERARSELRGVEVRFHPDEIRRDLHDIPFDDFSIPMARPGGHITDALVALRRFDILAEYADIVHEQIPSIMFSTHFAGTTIPLMDRENVRCDGYVVPVNKLGALMWPTQGEVERAIGMTVKPVFAIKPLAGGYSLGRESFDYVFKTVKADGALVGVASMEEACSTFSAAKESLESLA